MEIIEVLNFSCDSVKIQEKYKEITVETKRTYGGFGGLGGTEFFKYYDMKDNLLLETEPQSHRYVPPSPHYKGELIFKHIEKLSTPERISMIERKMRIGEKMDCLIEEGGYLSFGLIEEEEDTL